MAQYTDNLYNKRTAEDTDTSGNHTLATTGAWTDVDATNASVAITPELAGDFNAFCTFSIQIVSSNATNNADLMFRLTDSTETSNPVSVRVVSGVNATTFVIPVTLVHQFDDWSAAAKTVKLQYFATTLTAVTITLLANTTVPVYLKAEKT